jgi:UDP-glucose/iron transport system permease protein
MEQTPAVILLTLPQLAVAFVPAAITVFLMARWSLAAGNALYALGRMLMQLLLIGYVLAWIFGADKAWMVLIVLLLMLLASAWIAVRTVPGERAHLFGASLLAITLGAGGTLVVITQGVLQLEPWFMPRYTIPLAGMILANGMTAVSLACERLYAELAHGVDWVIARNTAFQAAMIPVVNSLFAVGLVSLPGMMTGQILSGVEPTVAARYQIMVMCMIFASAGMSTALFLWLLQRRQVAV